MGRTLRAIVALAVAACRTAGTAPPPSPSPVDCQITVTRAADGRSGTAGCAPTASPAPIRVVAPAPQQKDEHKGKGRD
jgi:hypothetical protein